MAERRPADPSLPSKPRWYAPTPARFLLAVLVMQGVLFLSAHYRWFWFNERKGYTVLIAVASTAVALLLLAVLVAMSRFVKSRTQYSLATLLLIVVVMAIPCAWLARDIERARWQRETIAAFERRGGAGEYEIARANFVGPAKNDPAPTFLASQFGKEFFDDVFELRIPEATSADLRAVKHFPELRRLLIYRAKISDADLVQLKGLKQLRVIDLEGAPIGDSGLEHLASLKQLVALFATDTHITDTGLEHLKGLTQLRVVWLPVPPVTRQGIDLLRRALPMCATGIR
jgi:hypothetical protein